MLGQSTPVKSFPGHAINDPKNVDTRANRQLMTREHYFLSPSKSGHDAQLFLIKTAL